MPEISVIIPVYNRERYIETAVASILAQNGAPSLELLVVDDGSTDDSVARVEAIQDPRVRVLRAAENGGIAHARNRGIAAARGRYAAFLDSDDIARPDRLARQFAFLERNPSHAAVGAWIGWIDDRGHRLSRIKRKPRRARLIAAERLFRSGIENSTAMARRDILAAYPHDESLVVGSDYDLWARIARDHDVANLPHLLVDRRQHDAQATAENVSRDRRFRCRIFAWQLDELGIEHSEDDRIRHYRLRRFNKAGDAPDAEYLDWAEDWLQRLRAANQRANCYPEPEFSRLLSLFWASACVHAQSRTHGLRRLAGSSLSSALPAGLWQGWSQRRRLPRHRIALPASSS